MKAHPVALGALALLTVITARSAVVPARLHTAPASSTPAVSHLRAFGVRGPQTAGSPGAKLDSALADLSRHTSLVRPGHELADLRSLAPALHFTQRSPGEAPLVLVDAVTRGDPQKLKTALMGLGLVHASVFSNDVSGWLPVSQIAAASARVELHSLRASMSRTRAGSVMTQGDFAQRSDLVRQNLGVNGSGVTVGVLSDSFNCYAQYASPSSGVPASGYAGYAPNGFLNTASDDVASGDLSTVHVLQEISCLSYGAPVFLPYADEGRAMLQIVHDVAPGANLAFYTAENSGEADFANGITSLAAAGAQVIADDVGYFDEPFFQDGIVAQAIDQVGAQGVAYFSAAGNNADLAYENTAPNFLTVSTSAPNAGENLLNFDTTGATTSTSLPVTIPALYPGEFLALVLEWDQPYVTGASGSPGASSHMDLCVSGATGTDHITDLNGNSVACTGANATGSDPVQILLISNPANASGPTAAENLNIMIGVAGGTTPPTRVILAVEDNGAGATINNFATHSATLQGHPGAASAAAVGAAYYLDTPRCGATSAMLESYSARGGQPILFDTNGAALATPVVRQKPEFVGPDGVNTTFFGQVDSTNNGSTIPQCANGLTTATPASAYPSFYGTSAATPHVAAIAALMLQANPAATPAQIYGALQSSALAMGGSSPNFDSGYGFVQADAAVALIPPGAPTVTLGPDTVLPGAQTTLTWSSINATSCTASGAWSGAQTTSGTAAFTAPTSVGTTTYTLTCSNAGGTSAATSATLTVTNSTSGGGGSGSTQPPSHSGGGSIEELTLLVLASLGFARVIRKSAAAGKAQRMRLSVKKR